ncbi:MAG: PA14 domain-containing protein [Planctomycetota bacterium]
MTRLTTICITFTIVGLMFAGQSYAQVDPDTILGMWLFDEGAGDVAADASGNGRDGTLIGAPNWINGKFGSALEFVSGSYVDCGNDPALNVDVFSVSFWCNIAATQGWLHMVSRGQHFGGGNPGANNWGVMMVDAAETIRYEVFNDTGWSTIDADTTLGTWHHVVATYDGVSGQMQLYHDGVLAASGTGGIMLQEDKPLFIGAQSRDTGPGGSFNGSIDEVAYFNAILSPDEVLAIMEGGLEGIGGGQPLARRPDPEDGALIEQTWGTLSWSAGDWAVSHDVYIGENFDDVNSGAADTFVGNQAATTLIVGFAGFPLPDGLVPGTTYYWRIDEVNDANTASPWKGDVWSFSIPSKTGYNPVPSDGAKFMETDGVTLGWTPGFDARVHYVYFGESFDEVDNAAGALPQANATFAPAGPLEAETTYYWRIDEFDAVETHKGPVWSFTTAGPGGGVKGQYYNGMNFETLVATRDDPQIDFNWGSGGPDPAAGDDQFSARWTGEVEAAFTETYTFYTNSDDGVRLWVEGQLLVNNWTDHGPTEDKGTIDLVAGNTYSLQMEYYENGGGAVAELRWSSPRTPKQVIPQAALSLPIKAGTPKPANGAAGTSFTPILAWNPGDNATSHEVYFGTDADAVANATKASPEFKATKALGTESHDPGKLTWDTVYYWRVDAINDADPDSPWVGNVWSFRTGDFLVVDDFESYDDIDPPPGEGGANRIFDKWIDGFGTLTNGALVGNDFPPYAEQTIVHGGAQSMIYRYDNAGKTSEATLTLVYPRDWTEEDVTKLSLWINGSPTNAADRIFVALNDTAVVYHDDPAATQIGRWTEWVIDLATFGVDLTNVNTLTIGVGTKNAPAPGGGAGTMYFDDIRLYR